MAREQKLSDEELKSIQELRNANQQLTIEFGRIQIAERQLNERKTNAENKYEELKEREQELLDNLSEKYQNGSIDLDKGVFKPSADEKQQENQSPTPQTPKTTFDEPAVRDYE